MSEYWNKLSSRERRLALGTAALIGAGVVLLTVQRVVTGLGDLDSRIAMLEQELVNLYEAEARSASIEEAYRAVAAEHSSSWTKEEIFDRLRQEVYRLALRRPADAAEAEVTANRGSYMVNIPVLREGVLKEEGDGYREYQVSFNLEPAPIGSVLEYLKRLQSSDQMLRVDRVEIGRGVRDTLVTTRLDVTRTVVDSLLEGEEAAAARQRVLPGQRESFEFEVRDNTIPYWLSEGVELERDEEHATHGRFSLAVTSVEGEGSIYQVQELEGGASYKLILDVASSDPVTISIEDANAPLAGGTREVKADGKTYRYEFRFDVPGNASQRLNLKAPVVAFDRSGGRLFVDNVMLSKVEES